MIKVQTKEVKDYDHFRKKKYRNRNKNLKKNKANPTRLLMTVTKITLKYYEIKLEKKIK